MSKPTMREESVRNELFAGRDMGGGTGLRGNSKKAINLNPDAAAWSDDPSTAALTTQQLVDQAVTTHKDTTRTAKRALQVRAPCCNRRCKIIQQLHTSSETLHFIRQGCDCRKFF